MRIPIRKMGFLSGLVIVGHRHILYWKFVERWVKLLEFITESTLAYIPHIVIKTQRLCFLVWPKCLMFCLFQKKYSTLHLCSILLLSQFSFFCFWFTELFKRVSFKVMNYGFHSVIKTSKLVFFDYFVYSLILTNMTEVSPMLIVLISFHSENFSCGIFSDIDWINYVVLSSNLTQDCILC